MSTPPLLGPITKNRRTLRPVQLRAIAFMLMLGTAFLGLTARLWYLQVFMGDELQQQSLESRTKLIHTRAPRGDIVDRVGRPLADSRQSLSLEISPDFETTNPRLLSLLSPILQMPLQDLTNLVQQEKTKLSPYDAIRVMDHLTPSQVARLEERRIDLNGILIEPNPVRHYPLGTVATHILGYLGRINDAEYESLKRYGYGIDDYVGKTGLEKQYNNLLRGEDGGRTVEVDAAGNIKRVLSEAPSHPGNTLTLSIDRPVQEAAQTMLATEGKAGAAVAIDPRNGEVLALATYPTYDLSVYSTRRTPDLWNGLVHDLTHPLWNRALSMQYPPASTFKPIIAVTGLTSGSIPADMTAYCAHGMRIGKQFKRCWQFHGSVNLEKAIAQSCDVFFYTAGMKMGIDQIAAGAENFGYGTETGIDLGGETSGEVPDAVWRKKHKRANWYLGNTANCSIGQGEVQATPLQVANAMATIANHGYLYQPRLLLKATSWNGKVEYRSKPSYRRIRASPEALERVRQAMRLAVTSGTAKVVNLPNIEVAGKTGTAQTRSDKANHGWFACFAPLSAPRIAIAVIVEGGIHGGTTGGPIAKAMLQAYFTGVPPAGAVMIDAHPPIVPPIPQEMANPSASVAARMPPSAALGSFELLHGAPKPVVKPASPSAAVGKAASPASEKKPLLKRRGRRGRWRRYRHRSRSASGAAHGSPATPSSTGAGPPSTGGGAPAESGSPG